jgi:Cu-Zn family superoxide dismutase
VLVAVLRGESSVKGEVVFEQTSEDSPTKVTYNISGMDPSSRRGFHVQYVSHTFNSTMNSMF